MHDWTNDDRAVRISTMGRDPLGRKSPLRRHPTSQTITALRGLAPCRQAANIGIERGATSRVPSKTVGSTTMPEAANAAGLSHEITGLERETMKRVAFRLLPMLI